MAGGIFADQPFSANPKCVVISIVLMILYWLLPYRNPFMLPVIFLVGYIAIAWYDYLYNCDLQMYSGTFPVSLATLDAWGKPQRRFSEAGHSEKPQQKPLTGEDLAKIVKKKLLENQELMYKKKIYALHAIFIAPILFYIGYYGKNANKNIWAVIISMAFLVLLYHGLRLFYPREVTSCVEEDKKERQQLIVIYLIHVLAVAPLLFYVGWLGQKADRRVWAPLLGLSVFLFLYHGIRYFYPREIKENCKKN